jgi:hypothetical protein
VKKTVRIPVAAAEGSHVVRVTGANAKRTGHDSVYVVQKSKALKVSLSPKAKVQANRTVTITVRSLAPHEKVTVSYGGQRISKKSAKASASGVYRITVPAGYSWGLKKIAVSGLTAHRAAKTTITVVPRR